MANSRRPGLKLLLFLFFLCIPITLAEPILPLSSSIAQSVPAALPDQQLHNIIEALIGAGDFSDWAKVLSAADPSTFPLTATLFIPKDGVLANILPQPSPPRLPLFDPTIFAYHIVPQFLNFSDLQRFPIGSRLPTMLPDKYIFVTDNSKSNYTIDDCRITNPDLFIDGPVAVHGIASMLDRNAFGNGENESSTSDGLSSSSSNGSNADPPDKNDDKDDVCLRSDTSAGSDAALLCCEFPTVLSLIVCAVLWFKDIHDLYSTH